MISNLEQSEFGPIMVFSKVLCHLANPKSAILIAPCSSIKRLAGFKSLEEKKNQYGKFASNPGYKLHTCEECDAGGRRVNPIEHFFLIKIQILCSQPAEAGRSKT